MDPDEALKVARVATATIHGAENAMTESYIVAAEELAEAFTALDEWLSKGGFPPRGWCGRA